MIPPCPQGWTHTDNLLPLPSCAQVGAVSIRATLNCEAFADAHRASAHYDQSSFVGLAWRPEGESCCVEVYSTGRANLPGSRTERALNASFYRMLPELRTLLAPLHTIPYLRIDTLCILTVDPPHPVCVFSVRYSSAHQLVDHIPEAVQAVHRGMCAAASLAPEPVAPVPRAPEPASESDEEEGQPDHPDEADIDDDMLGALGL